MKYKFYKEQGILECFVYSVKNSELEQARKIQEQKERLGIESSIDGENEDEKIYGEPIEIVLDLNAFNGLAFFTPNKVELFEENNFEEGVYVEFIQDTDFVLLISYKDFKKIYFEFKGITNGN